MIPSRRSIRTVSYLLAYSSNFAKVPPLLTLALPLHLPFPVGGGRPVGRDGGSDDFAKQERVDGLRPNLAQNLRTFSMYFSGSSVGRRTSPH